MSSWLAAVSFTKLGNFERKLTLVEVTFGHGTTEITYRTLKWKLRNSNRNLEVNTKVVGEVLKVGEVVQEGSVGYE